MSNVRSALTRARSLVNEAAVRTGSVEFQEGVERWTWAQAKLNEAIGELDAEHVRLPSGEAIPSTPSPEDLVPSFDELIDQVLEAIESCDALRRQRLQRLELDLGEMPDDGSHESTVEVLRWLYRARLVAEHHKPANT